MSDQIEVIDNLAADLGVGEEARRKWRERGRVAHRWRLPIMEAAMKAGQPIDTALFENYHVTTASG